MSVAKHTPGPFHVESGAVWAEAQDGTNLKLAQICAVLNHVSMVERNANAALFAASPDLLASLKAIMPHVTPGTCSEKHAFKNARLAIAKAEGRA